MEKVTLKIIANGMNGEGIARLNNKVVFVNDGVEGDLALCEIVKENKNFSIAKICEIITPSAFREPPQCPYFGECGGCSLQHINYEKQLKIKAQNVQNLFDKQKLKVNVLPCVGGAPYEYRNKLSLYFSKNKQLGFYIKKSNQIIPINYCYLVDENFNNLINKLNIFLKNNNEFSPLILKAISIRQINDKTYIFNLILTKKINLIKLQNYLKLNKINYSLYYCINTKNNLPTAECFFEGGNNIVTKEFNIAYPVHPLSFLQVNNQIKSQVYNKILSLIKDNMVVLDAYSGAGLLSAMMSKKSKFVYAIEIEQSATNACQSLCKQNGIKNLKAINGDCKTEIPKLLQKTKIDVVVLDPARRGVDLESLNAIKKANPQTIIYLSCNSATLTRDLQILCKNGEYQISFAQPYDMFAQTSEVETLVLLEKTANN